MPGSGSPTVRRRELGALLRELRNGRGWTVEQVAERLLVSPSKVSRLETGQRGASLRDIRDLSQLYGLTDQQSQQLIELAAEGKQRAWWTAYDLPYSTYVGLEAEAASISDFALGLVPGLLQTAEYAQATLGADLPPLADHVIEQRITARMDRQRLLRTADGPVFEAIIDESVLHRVIGSRAVLRAQLGQLLALSDLPSVTIRVLPYTAGSLPVPNTKFIILTFEQPALADVVFIEALTGDAYLSRPEEVSVYKDAFDVMRGIAASTDSSCAMIAAIADTLGD